MNKPFEPQDHDSAHRAGTAERRDAMLHELVAAMHHLHRRRRGRKRIGATLALMLLLGAVLVLALPRPTPQQSPRLAHTPEPPAQPSPEPSTERYPPPRVEIVLVRTDPDIMQRYAVSGSPRMVQMIDDDELLATLADMDRPTGIVRTAGAVWLTAAVTDEELAGNGEHDRRGRSIF